jgi:hypothetical protein
MLDPLPKFLIELRSDAAVAAIVGANPDESPPRVRGFKPHASDVKSQADGYRAFVVLAQLASPRHPRLPIQRPRIAVRCAGRTKEEAAALYGACSEVLHNRFGRVHSNGLGIYASFDGTGGTEEEDPDTGQPVYTFIVEALATTQVVTA